MRGILFDMDGTLYDSNGPIEGAAEVVGFVRARSIPHLFVTNTTSRDCRALVDKLGQFGIQAEESRILTPCVAAAQWLRARDDGATALFVSPGASGEFEGLECLPQDAEAGARYIVIGDLGDAWDFRALNRAFRLLHSNPEAVLLALGMTRFWQARDGVRLDVAPFIAALEHATGKKALVFGKPAEHFFHAAAEQLRLPAGEIIMVGDDIETDIAGAQQAGLKGVLVRTGKFRPADLKGTIPPDAVLDSIRDLPGWLTSHRVVESPVR